MMRNILEGIFAPAVMLMSRLRYWQKFVTLTILFTIPVGFALFSYITQIQQRIAFAEKEIIGVQYISSVLSLLQNLQQHRGMASLYLNGEESFLPRLEEKKKNIEDNFLLIEARNQEFGKELGTADAARSLRKKWAVLEKTFTQLTPKESARQHTEFISEGLALIFNVSDASNVTLDPDLDSYYLMNTVVNTLPNLSENLGQSRAFTLSVQDPKNISDAERRDLINFIKIARSANEKIQRDMRVAFKTNNSLEAILNEPLSAMSSSVNSLVSLLGTFVDTSKIEMSFPEYYAFSTTVIDTNFSLLASVSPALITLLERRIDGLISEQRTITSVTAFSYILILYFLMGFYFLVERTVREFKDIAERLIGGKEAEAHILSRDELGDAGKSFNAVGRALQASAHELESKVKDLERFNKLMVNRELKMIELKKEIEELKKKAEQYHS